MNGLGAFRIAAQICATIGVSKVIGDVIKNNVNIVTGVDAARVKVGTAVLGTLITGQATRYVESVIDGAVLKFNERVEKAKEKAEAEDEPKNEEDEKKDVDG